VQKRWLASYLIKQRELAGLRRVTPLVVENFTEENVRAWLKREKPDVVIAPSPYQLLHWFKRWGLRVPDDLGVASLSSPAMGDPLTGIYQNAALVGARAVDLLVGLIEHNEAGLPEHPNALLIDGTWNQGSTVRKIG
jgi:DNA-binding LacI/PurR family transcriptional regulator